MPRHSNTLAAPAEGGVIKPEIASRMVAGQDLAAEAQAAAHHLALELSYDGTLTVGALEDGIRFYQRRSVEALLETGKRLLLLKELTPRGEFDERAEPLGFTRRTAYRFMQAAAKTAKSANLARLATEVKSASVFLEFVVEDDDTIERALDEIDDVDAITGQQARAALRKATAENARLQAVGAELHQELMALKVRGKVVAITDWPDALQPLSEQIAAAGRKLATGVSELETCRITLFERAAELDADARPALEAAMGHVAEVYQAALARAERALGRERNTFEQTLGAMRDVGAERAARVAEAI